GGSHRYTLPKTGSLAVGWAVLAAGSGTVRGSATVELDARDGSLITMASLPGIEAGNSFILPVDITATASTGVAIANVADDRAFNVNLQLLNEDGSGMAAASDVRLNPLGAQLQIADFVTRLFPQLTGTTFKGSLVVEAAAGTLANSLVAAALAIKEGSFSAVPVVPGGVSSTS